MVREPDFRMNWNHFIIFMLISYDETASIHIRIPAGHDPSSP